jgi:hypothetical protein
MELTSLPNGERNALSRPNPFTAILCGVTAERGSNENLRKPLNGLLKTIQKRLYGKERETECSQLRVYTK